MKIDRKKFDGIHDDIIGKLKKFNPIACKFEDRLKSNLEGHYHKILDYVIEKYPSGNLYESTLLIQGLTTRSLNLFLGILRELVHSNTLVVNILLRQYLETVAITFYTSWKPEYLQTALVGQGKRVNILTMIDHLDKKRYPGTRKDYDYLSETLHPNSKSHFLYSKPINEKNRIAQFTTYTVLSNGDVEKYLEFINTWVERFFEELKSLDKLALKEK